MGWIELVPTNGIPADVDHIVVANGRDYRDYFVVAPLIGVLKSYGRQTIRQAGDVIPI